MVHSLAIAGIIVARQVLGQYLLKFPVKLKEIKLVLSMPKLLKAKDIIDAELPRLTQKCHELEQRGLKPNLNVVLVGDNPASHSYVKNKKRMCEKIGAQFVLHHLASDIPETEFLNLLGKINNDKAVTGCFVQLPIPKHLQHLDVTQMINPTKDVDGFHLNTVCDLYLGNLDKVIPCTPKGIITMLRKNNIQIEGADIVIIGRSHIVGKPLSLILEGLNATVTLCHSRTKDLKKHTRSADIVISAVGRAEFLNADYLKDGSTVIDVGINKTDKGLVGDVDFASATEKAIAITPVPGGVGPMTVFSLMENLLMTTETILKERS